METPQKTRDQKLDEVMQQIHREPSRWCQNRWFEDSIDYSTGESCGTAACFAGWTCLLNGWKRAEPNERVHRDGNTEHVRVAAQQELHLSYEDACTLFHGSNDLADLNGMVASLRRYGFIRYGADGVDS